MSLQTSWKFSVWHLQKEEEPGGRYLKEDSVPKSVIRPALLPSRCLASSLQTLGISHLGWGPGHTPSWSPCLQSVLRLNNLPCCCSTSSSRLPTTCSPARLSAGDTLTPPFPPLLVPPCLCSLPVSHTPGNSALLTHFPTAFSCLFAFASLECFSWIALPVPRDHISRKSIKIILSMSLQKTFMEWPLCPTLKIQQ